MLSNKWFILLLVILMYLPVSIDATILHIAIPTLSFVFSANANQILWVMDIYPLVIAGLLLPMGALGDRIGYRKLAITGLLAFAAASLLAGLSISIYMLIIGRALLGIGAAMILPATLAGIRHLFSDAKERSTAIALWSAVGIGGAAAGPLLGGYLLEHYYWGSVFLINLPMALCIAILLFYFAPEQSSKTTQKLEIKKSLLFVVLLILLVYSAKALLRAKQLDVGSLLTGSISTLVMIGFVRNELKSPNPMIDFSLFKNRVIMTGVLMAFFSMVSIVGFELAIIQELQFVYDLTPLRAGLFILPLILASGAGGFLASWLNARTSIRFIGISGVFLSACCFFALASINIMHNIPLTVTLLIIQGATLNTALFASTAAIMSSVNAEKAASAGAIESMAYELGAGFGIVIFGILLSLGFAHSILLPDGLTAIQIQQASHSINETLLLATEIQAPSLQDQLTAAAKTAFLESHKMVLTVAGCILLLVSAIVYKFLPRRI